jgi:hypothetical protein
MIKEMSRVGAPIVNLGRSIRFYRDLLDIDVLGEEAPSGGEVCENKPAISGAMGTCICGRSGTGSLELWEILQPSPRAKDPNNPSSEYALSYLCIEVGDIDGVYERLRRAGHFFLPPAAQFFRSRSGDLRPRSGRLFVRVAGVGRVAKSG